MVSAFAGLILVIGVAAADNAVTFENLNSHLSPEQAGAIHRFDSLLAAALEGALEARLTLANEIYFDRLEALALGLYRQIYDAHGYRFQDLERPEMALTAYARLGDMYLEGRGTAFDPQAGFRLLTQLAAQRHEAAMHSIRYFLAESRYLPDSGNLGELWSRYAETGVSAGPAEIAEEPWEEDPEAPEDSSFGACPNALGQTGAIVGQFNARQAAMLEDGKATPEELSRAYESFEFEGISAGHRMYTFLFSDVPASALFGLMADAFEDDGIQWKSDLTLSQYRVEVAGNNVPLMLMFSHLVEALQLEVSCTGHWMRIAPGSAQPEVVKVLLLPNFISERNPLTGSGSGELIWENGVRYTGALKNGRPNGQGRLVLSDHPQAGSQIVGEFRDGVPHGRAEYSIAHNSMKYSGEFQNGMFHGAGHLRDSSGTDLRGRFVHHRFQGSGSQYLKGDAGREEPWLLYAGPFKDGVPHGAGLCDTPLGDYECEMANGLLIGLGEVSLLPGQTQKGVSP